MQLFQNDGAAIHSSLVINKEMRYIVISTLTWPAKSLDIYFAEHVSGVMARSVYSGHCAYNNLNDLNAEIKNVLGMLNCRIFTKALTRLAS